MQGPLINIESIRALNSDLFYNSMNLLKFLELYSYSSDQPNVIYFNHLAQNFEHQAIS